MKKIIFVVQLLFCLSSFGQTSEEYFHNGIGKGKLKDFRGAIFDFTKAIELEPNLANSSFNRGYMKGELLDYKGAIVDFTKVIELEPNDVEAYKRRGVAKIMLGQKNSGCLDLSEAGQLGNAAAYNLIKRYCN
jgi:tetratricopeptide (TPR) repeat protein